MFSLMMNKLLNKKWMVLCLLIGNILLISVAASYPLYRVSSFQRMLKDEFDDYAGENDCFPSILQVDYQIAKGNGGTAFTAMEQKAFQASEKLGVQSIDNISDYSFNSQSVAPTVVRDRVKSKNVILSAVTGLEEHVEILYGRLPEDVLDGEGRMEVMVSDEAMVGQDILLEDEYTFNLVNLPDGSPLVLTVVGIFRPLDETEVYWEAVGKDVSQKVYTRSALFRDTFLKKDAENQYTLNGKWSFIWDYNALDIGQVNGVIHTMETLETDEDLKGKITDSGYVQILNEYREKAKRTEATLLILQVPVLLLLCAFLYMIAGQMLKMEQNEISLLRSRGASKRQVFLLYLMQSTFLSILSMLAAVPLGMAFCRLLGSSTAFLEFSSTRSLAVRFTPEVIPYVAGAVALSVVVTTLPVLPYSGLSIVKLKQGRSRQKKALWKKLYLDVVLLALSLYGYYSFQRSSGQMEQEILSGKALDPLLYISFSMFILGAGLLCARLQPLILKGFFTLFKNHIKPSTYASLLGSIRTGAKQDFIILFLILTVSIGISDTMIARTIVLNAVNNSQHLLGADIVLKEKWYDTKAMRAQHPEMNLPLEYTEPDFSKFEEIPGTEQVTPVLKVQSKMGSSMDNIPVTVMGIRTRGFYEVTHMESGLLPFSYVDYLNVLAAGQRAVLVSENFMLKQGCKLGDVISYESPDGIKTAGRIYGFFNYWPTYQPQSYTVNEDGTAELADNYMIVANFSYLKDSWGIASPPYEVWMSANDGGEGFYGWMEKQEDMKLVKLEDMGKVEERIVNDTMFQGTNGVLSMSFIVILLLCCVGYLIYWIMSIRSRELLFGVLRAMGMRKAEITWLLTVEQICSGFYAIVCGGGIGILASTMFVPMIQQAYAAAEQILPLRVITQASDMIQLFTVIALMLLVCLTVIGRIVSKLNISSALKLGED